MQDNLNDLVENKADHHIEFDIFMLSYFTLLVAGFQNRKLKGPMKRLKAQKECKKFTLTNSTLSFLVMTPLNFFIATFTSSLSDFFHTPR